MRTYVIDTSRGLPAAGVFVAFWISVIHGLFGVKETTTGSSEGLAEIAEYSAVAFGLAVVLTLLLPLGSGAARKPLRVTPARRRPVFAPHVARRR